MITATCLSICVGRMSAPPARSRGANPQAVESKIAVVGNRDDGGFLFKPCIADVPLSALVKIAVLFWTASFLVVLILGLWNRRAPRWLAICGLLSFMVMGNRLPWPVQPYPAYRPGTAYWIFAAAFVAMCPHHVVGPRLHRQERA